MKQISILLLAALLAMPTASLLAKRAPPLMVRPVIMAGVKYLAPHVTAGYTEAHGAPACTPGCIEAWDEKTGKLLWRTQVYEVTYDKSLERDAQDNYIRSLSIQSDHLSVENEHGQTFVVDLETHEAQRLWVERF